MPPLQAACVSFVLAAFGDPVDDHMRFIDGELHSLSEETRLLMLGDYRYRMDNVARFGKKAVPWLTRAVLIKPEQMRGLSRLRSEIEALIGEGRGRGFLPVLHLLRANDILNNRPHDHLDELIEKIERRKK